MQPFHAAYPALAWAAVVEVLSPFAILAIGSSVSDTIKKIVAESCYTNPEAKSVALAFITAGIVAAILWNLTTWLLAIPASSSHALIGGVVGAGIAAFGTSAISWNYFWTKVVMMIFVTPIVSFIVGFLILILLRFLTSRASLRAHTFFTYAQWFNMSFLAFNHSFNDSQKTIGIVMILIGIFGGARERFSLGNRGRGALPLAWHCVRRVQIIKNRRNGHLQSAGN